MAAEVRRDRFSTATRLRAFGEQAAARVYRAQSRRLRRPPRRTRLTGRAALLALVVCGLVVALIYPLRQYVAQRADIAEQQRAANAARERVEMLRDAKARWQDPAYVARQAREHLQYVWPGETGYLVPEDPARDPDQDRVPEGSAAAREAEEAARAEEDAAARERREEREAAADRPWYDRLWEGVERAGESR